jgi:tetratricopeptide (TPR) repeat protein
MSDRFPAALLRRVALLALLLGTAPALLGCDSMPLSEGAEKKKDEAAKADFYETSALTYYDGGKYETAVQMWEKVLLQKPDNQKAKWGLAKALQMIGTAQSLRRAEAILLPIIDLDWSHPEIGDRRHEVKGTLAMVYQDLADLYERDVRYLQDRVRAVEEKREPVPEAGMAELYAALQKQIAMRNEQLVKAIPLWETSLAVKDDHPYALAGLGKAHLMLGHDEQGLEYSRRYIMVARSSQGGWRRKMKDWQEFKGREGMTQPQREVFVKNIQEARDNELKMHLLLGSVHMRREEYPLALDEYNAVLEIDPATPAALVERAQAQAKLGKFPLAVQDLEDYLKVTDPEKQRTARSRAAELLDKYRKMAGQEGLFKSPPAGAPGQLPAQPR